jgi:hypothetical protein
MPYFVYTQEDIEFLLAVGIDPKRIKPNDFGIRKNQIPVP